MDRTLNAYISTEWFQCITGKEGEMVIQMKVTEKELESALKLAQEDYRDRHCNECGAEYTWSTNHKNGCSVIPF